MRDLFVTFKNIYGSPLDNGYFFFENKNTIYILYKTLKFSKNGFFSIFNKNCILLNKLNYGKLV